MAELVVARAEQIIQRAYHGTTLPRARSIEAEGFRLSTGPNCWLGDGVYFYEEGFRLALEWATEHVIGKAGLSEEAAVFQVRIDLGHCLNLDIESHQELISDVGDQLKAL